MDPIVNIVKSNQQIKIVLFTWTINMLILVIVGFFPIKPQDFLNLRGLFNVIVILYLLRYMGKLDLISKIIVLFVIYLFTLCLFSSNMRLTFIMTIKTAIGMLMFLVGRHFFSYSYSFNKLMEYFKYLYIILLLSIAFSNITGIGDIGYAEETARSETVLFGAIGVAITKILGFVILLSPVYMLSVKMVRRKSIIIILVFIGIVLTMISFKRSSVLALIAGVLVYALLIDKKKVVTFIVYLFVLAFLSFPLYQHYLSSSYENRKSKLYYVSDEAESIDQEARYWETVNVINALKKDNLTHFIFGSELFNEFSYFNTKRMLHIDYNVILNGSGVFGLFLFLFIYYLMIRKAWLYYNHQKSKHIKMISISIISIVVFVLFMSVGGGVRSFDLRGPIFLYLGSALGFIEREFARQKYLNYFSKHYNLDSTEN